jgi:16S rRNA G966 N2-methylase RsmD
MRPLFSYFGGKWKHVPKYPMPEHDYVIEPFAGAAGYSTAYYRRKVILVEKNPKVAAMWRWLLKVQPEVIRKLPILRAGELISEQAAEWCEEARTFLGFRVAAGRQEVSNRASPWGSKAWDWRAREFVARQVELIRHWTIIEGDYWLAPDVPATWFVDPPYQKEGFRYTCSSDALDFTKLGEWCRARKGLVMVCENEGADWLPFVPLYQMAGASKSGEGGRSKVSTEVLWIDRQ